ncbi:MAG: C69 family dipeptidase, partial [Firmicutes bacterium]|nr:C69 family dipeptidase [Bacillota bacterium]
METTYYCYPGLELGNCSTVIIGKDASATGNFIVGHNEDDEDCVAQTHLVPRIKHEPGSLIQFADAKAVIPQVEETYAYFWSEVRRKGGISFADGFINEWGVSIVTDSCRPGRDASGCPKDNPEAYGIGYALRRIVAERAKTAREGVQI